MDDCIVKYTCWAQFQLSLSSSIPDERRDISTNVITSHNTFVYKKTIFLDKNCSVIQTFTVTRDTKSYDRYVASQAMNLSWCINHLAFCIWQQCRMTSLVQALILSCQLWLVNNECKKRFCRWNGNSVKRFFPGDSSKLFIILTGKLWQMF